MVIHVQRAGLNRHVFFMKILAAKKKKKKKNEIKSPVDKEGSTWVISAFLRF